MPTTLIGWRLWSMNGSGSDSEVGILIWCMSLSVGIDHCYTLRRPLPQAPRKSEKFNSLRFVCCCLAVSIYPLLWFLMISRPIYHRLLVSYRATGQIFRIGTVRYAEGLWRMRRHGPVIAHSTDSEDFPATVLWMKDYRYLSHISSNPCCWP